ncbi:hypothetical protein [Streptomyces sp. NBC_00989]|uniref:hypothetical protein n=1 Tax=Streptomyces sp. NBC_00989 TaxID=2903705 RepID=UPI00386F3F56|nr:hypothetical protein OG714_17765 [Streptomyces sp. NBC_00989]
MPWTENVRLIDDHGERPKKSKSQPALDGSTSWGLVMVHLGDKSSRIWWSSIRESGEWNSDREVLTLRAEQAPTMARGLMVFPDSGSGRIFRASVEPGWVFNEDDPEPKNAQGWSLAAHIWPAMAFSDGMFHIFYRNKRRDIVHTLLRKDQLESQEIPGNSEHGLFASKARPAIAIMENTLHLVHLGRKSNQIWHSKGEISIVDKGELSIEWSEKRVGGQKSKASPALAVFNGRLHMVHIGDSSTRLWHAIYVPELDSWTQEQISGQRSKTTPGLASYAGRLHMVHLGEKSNQLWWSRWRDR